MVKSGELGELRHVETSFCVPYVKPDQVRYSYELSGGALMDVGCYGVHQLRSIVGHQPKVVAARAKTVSEKVDRYARAELSLNNGGTARITCSLLSARLLGSSALVVGTKAILRATNLIGPQYFNWLSIETQKSKKRYSVPGKPTYHYQLVEFARRASQRDIVHLDLTDSIENMDLIDKIYSAAGLPVRGLG